MAEIVEFDDPRKAKFVEEFVRLGSGKAAAIAAGWRPEIAAHTAWRLLKDPQVQDAIKEAHQSWLEERTAMIRATIDPAIATLLDVVQGNVPPKGAQARVIAATALLDRAGFTPVQRVEQKTQAETLVINLTPDDLNL